MKANIVLSSPANQCLTFFWPNRPDFYVGYRIIEHDPEQRAEPLADIDRNVRGSAPSFPETMTEELLEGPDPLKKGWINTYDEDDEACRIQLKFRSFQNGCAWASGLDNGGDQMREFFFNPVDDGIEMWMKLTSTMAISGALAVQQCLRFSGVTSKEWRQAIARVPDLSEYDYQAQGKPNDTLSHYRKGESWTPFPLPQSFVQTRGGAAPTTKATLDTSDHGLVVRESADQKWSSGMYWDRTVYNSNRHPADCLHSSVEFGPLQAGESRTVRGKFYLIEGNKDELLEHWKRDFS